MIQSILKKLIIVLLLCTNISAEEPFVILELFTSQGCSSCPPADSLLKEVHQNSQRNKLPVYALSFHVDYWNRLGWQDPYSGKNATDRQYQYARVLKSQSVYTPQLIIDGTYDVLGSDRRKINQIIKKSLAKTRKTSLSVKKITKEKGTSWTLRYNSSGHNQGDILRLAIVNENKSNFVPAGENAGKTLSHTNVVQAFSSIKLGRNNQGSFSLNTKATGTLIAFVQKPSSMKIISASKVQL